MGIYKYEQDLSIICADIKNYVETLEHSLDIPKIDKNTLSDFDSALNNVMQDSILVSEQDLECINDMRMQYREIYRDTHPKPNDLRELVRTFNEFNSHSEIRDLYQSIEEERNIKIQP